MRPDERAPAFQFYWKQWLSDDKVLAMSWPARAMHMHFICLAWQQSPACTLPDDDELLQAWVGFPADWPALKKQIFRAWRLDEASGRWVQDGLARVWETQQAYRLSRSQNASARQAKKPKRAPKSVEAHAEHVECSPSPSPSPNTTTPISPSAPPSAEALVEAHYLAMHPRRRVGSKDRTTIRRALAHGYTAADLCEAIDGNARDQWHRDKHKHELGYVLRDTGKIDDFRAKAASSGKPLVVDGWMSDELERETRPPGLRVGHG